MLNHTQRELLEADAGDDWGDWDADEWCDWPDEAVDEAPRERSMVVQLDQVKKEAPKQAWDGKAKIVSDCAQGNASAMMKPVISKPKKSLQPPASGAPSFDNRFGVRVIDTLAQFLNWNHLHPIQPLDDTHLTSIGRLTAACRRFCRLLWLAGRETGLQLWLSALSRPDNEVVVDHVVTNAFGDAYYALLAREIAWCKNENLGDAVQRFRFQGKPGDINSIASLDHIPVCGATLQNSEQIGDSNVDSEDEQESLSRALSFERTRAKPRSIMAAWDEPLTSHELQALRGIECVSSRSIPGFLLHDAKFLQLAPEDWSYQDRLPRVVSADVGELVASSLFSVCHHLGASVGHVFSWNRLPLSEGDDTKSRSWFGTKLNIESLWFTDEDVIVIAGPFVKESTWTLQCWVLPPTSAAPLAERSLPAPVHCGIVPKRGPRALLMVSLGNGQVVAYRSRTLAVVKVWDCTSVVGSMHVAIDSVLGLVAWRGKHLLQLKTNGEVSEMVECLRHPGIASQAGHGSLFHLSCHRMEALVLLGTIVRSGTIIQVFAPGVECWSADPEAGSAESWKVCLQMHVHAVSQVLHLDSRKLIVLQYDHRLVVHFWPVGFVFNRGETIQTPLETIDLGRLLFGDCHSQFHQINCALCGCDASLGLLWIVAVSDAHEDGRARVCLWKRRGKPVKEQHKPKEASRPEISRPDISSEVEPPRPPTEKELKQKKQAEIAARQAAKKSLQAQRNEASKHRAKERAENR